MQRENVMGSEIRFGQGLHICYKVVVVKPLTDKNSYTKPIVMEYFLTLKLQR